MRTGFIIFLLLALFGDFIASDKPLVCSIKGKLFFPSMQQKAADCGILQADSVLNTRDWRGFRSYDWVVRSPVPFSAERPDKEPVKFTAPLQNGHLLGTDFLGRDVLAGLIAGCKVAFQIGIFSMLIAVFVGVVLGAMAGYFGTWCDNLILGLIEVKRAVPSVLWIFAVAAISDQCSLTQIVLIIGLLSWPGIALLMRSAVIKVKTADYILAARAIGCSEWRILFVHIIPNCLGPVYVAAAALVPAAVLTESALTFLGIGLPLQTVTWGSMLRQAQSDVSIWWLALFPGLCLFLLILLFNTYAERLRNTRTRV
jgi:peptide/nickel transport system permease protein